MSGASAMTNRRRVGSVFRLALLVVAMLATPGVAADRALAEPAPAPAAPLVALSPARLVDTRAGQSTVDGGGPKGLLRAGQTIVVAVAGRGGVPASEVAAVALNVTVVGATVDTYLTVWPTGTARPTASSVNAWNPAPVPNLVTAKVGSSGTVSIFNAAGAVDVVVDVAGYYPSGPGFVATNPARLLDTRAGQATVDGRGPKGALGPRGELVLPVAGRASVPSSGVTAVVLNLTAVSATASTHLTAWPSGTTRPNASALNPSTPFPLAGAAVVPLGSDGAVRVFNANGSVHVVADLAGWFTEGGGFTPSTPSRLVETRTGLPTVDGGGPRGILSGGQTLTVAATGRAGIPATGVGAVVFTLTAVDATQATFLAAWPTGGQRPMTSNLNPAGPAAVANLVVAKVGLDGSVSIVNDSGSTNVIVDVAGWLPGDPEEPVDAGAPPIDQRVVLPGMAAGDTIRFRLRLPTGTRFSIAAWPSPVGGNGLRCGATVTVRRTDLSVVTAAAAPCADEGNGLDLDSRFLGAPDGSADWFVDYRTELERSDVGGWLQLSTAVTTTATVNVAGSSPRLVPGQNAIVRFTPTVGAPFVVSWLPRSEFGEEIERCDVRMRLLRPDGSEAQAVTPANGGVCGGPLDTPPMRTDPQTSTGGTWSVELDNGVPNTRPASPFTVRQSDPPTPLTLPASVSATGLAAGLSRSWTFTGAAGQSLSLVGMLDLGVEPGCASLDLRGPNGTLRWGERYCQGPGAKTTGDRDVTLDATGTWTIMLTNERTLPLASFSLTAALGLEARATVGTPYTAPALVAGQNVSVRVALTSGQTVSVLLDAPSTPGQCRPMLQIRRPDGSVAAGEPADATTPTTCWAFAEPRDLDVDATGDWTFVIDGNVEPATAVRGRLFLSNALDGGELTVGTSQTAPTLLPRQIIRYRVGLVAGEAYDVTLGRTGAAIQLTRGVTAPDGTVTPPTSTGSTFVAPATGIYTFLFRNTWTTVQSGLTVSVLPAFDGGTLAPDVAKVAPALSAHRTYVLGLDLTAGVPVTLAGSLGPVVLVDPNGRIRTPAFVNTAGRYVPPLTGRFRLVHRSDPTPRAEGWATFTLWPGQRVTVAPGATVALGTLPPGELVWLETAAAVTGTLRLTPSVANQLAVAAYAWYSPSGDVLLTPPGTRTPLPTTTAPDGSVSITASGQRVAVLVANPHWPTLVPVALSVRLSP